MSAGRWRRRANWIAAAMLAMAGAAYAVLLLVNWRDQPVNPAAASLLALAQKNNGPADDAAAFLMGFSVERDEDPILVGQQRISWARRMAAQPAGSALGDQPGTIHDLDMNRSTPVLIMANTCKTVDRACLTALENGEATIARWLAAEQWLHERYGTLLARPAWREVAPFDARLPFPPYVTILAGQKLHFLRAWQAAGLGDARAVRALLEQDIRFWRQGLEGSGMLISKMIAVTALKRHFTWSSMVLRRLPSHLAAQAIPQQWHQPISDAERSLLPCLAGELVYLDTMLRHAKAGRYDQVSDPEPAATLFWPLLRPLLQVQDSGNRFAELMTAQAQAFNVPYEQYPQALVRARGILASTTEAAAAMRMYNIAGNAGFVANAASYAGYSVRAADLEGLRRIALLAAQMRARQVPSGDLAGALAAAALRNPYDGKPFEWDEVAGAIVFSGLQEGSDGRHAVLY